METPLLKTLVVLANIFFEAGTRNRLVHVNHAVQHTNCLNIIDKHSDEIYEPWDV